MRGFAKLSADRRWTLANLGGRTVHALGKGRTMSSADAKAARAKQLAQQTEQRHQAALRAYFGDRDLWSVEFRPDSYRLRG